MVRIKYTDIKDGFASKDCKLITPIEDFNKISRKTHAKLDIISSCGHMSSVQYCHFINYGSGIFCKDCSRINSGIKNKDKSITDGVSTAFIIENKAKDIFRELLVNNFIINDVNDGCKADLIIKPKNSKFDKWLKVQIKSTEKPAHNYRFHIDKKNYENCIIVLVCLSNEYIWIIPYENIKNITGIAIGKKRSKYDKYFISSNEELYDKIYYFYNTELLFNEHKCNIPTSLTHIIEYNYKLIRQRLNFIEFIKPKYEFMKYDFLINNTTHQEKVATYYKNKHTLQLFCNNGIKKERWYKYGENDYYWCWCNKINIFYVFPEQILLNNNLISLNEKNGRSTIHLYPHRTKEELDANNIKSRWTFDYRFDLDNLDKEKLLNLLNISET